MTFIGLTQIRTWLLAVMQRLFLVRGKFQAHEKYCERPQRPTEGAFFVEAEGTHLWWSAFPKLSSHKAEVGWSDQAVTPQLYLVSGKMQALEGNPRSKENFSVLTFLLLVDLRFMKRFCNTSQETGTNIKSTHAKENRYLVQSH